MEIKETLAVRGNLYGSFVTHGEISQRMKDVMRRSNSWERLRPDMKEALEMTAHKIARILNGDPFYKDSWHDIVGYATLIDETLKTVKEGL